MENKNTPRRIEELKDYLSKLQSGQEIPHRLITFMQEINILFLEGAMPFVKTTELHYTASSLIHEFLFADGKKYRIEISEVRE